MKYLMAGMFETSINKRDYEEVCYRKSLDPNMDPMERQEVIRQFMLRPDSDVVTSLRNRADGESKCEAFVAALCNAIKTDGEPWSEKCAAVASALASNNAQELLIALCGYGAGSLAKQAMIIPDDDAEFHKIGKKATLLVYWSNGETSQSTCHIDVASNKVYGYKRTVFSAYEDCASIRWVAVNVKPSFGKDHYLRWCISKEEREQLNDTVTYWYSRNPEEDQRAEPAIYIEDPFK